MGKFSVKGHKSLFCKIYLLFAKTFVNKRLDSKRYPLHIDSFLFQKGYGTAVIEKEQRQGDQRKITLAIFRNPRYNKIKEEKIRKSLERSP